jgi:glycosyltransferase involved in cell wall biosynthesis
MAFVHSRVKKYLEKKQDVTVISLSSKGNYTFDGVNVVTKSEGETMLGYSNDNIVMAHAPNIRNYVTFILKIFGRVKHLVLFFHGHEILNTRLYYPKPYDFDKAGKRTRLLLAIYDYIKLPIMKMFLKYINSHGKLDMVFVSDWMYSAFCESLRFNQDKSSKFKTHIINNPISGYIKQCAYNPKETFKADFISIRPLTGAKYAVDLITEFAMNNPEYTFHIYGKGDYFKYNFQPSNITVFNTFLDQKDIPSLLDNYRYALMPTKLDAQGVMMCEMACYGMPVIVSNLPVCREMLEHFDNVKFIDNDRFSKKYDAENLPVSKKSYSDKFSIDKICEKELSLFTDI